MSDQPISLNMSLLSRIAPKREELEREFLPLKDEFPMLMINKVDFTQLAQVGAATQMVVIDLESWLPSDELILSDVRKNGYRGPAVVLTSRLTEAASASYTAEQLIFFDRRSRPNELLGIVRRLLLGSVIASRKHPRHVTDEDADVQVEGGSSVHPCKVRNLSAGGALLDLTRELQLRVGDLVSVRIRLSKVARVHSVRARVAWVNGSQFGVEFLNS